MDLWGFVLGWTITAAAVSVGAGFVPCPALLCHGAEAQGSAAHHPSIWVKWTWNA